MKSRCLFLRLSHGRGKRRSICVFLLSKNRRSYSCRYQVSETKMLESYNIKINWKPKGIRKGPSSVKPCDIYNLRFRYTAAFNITTYEHHRHHLRTTITVTLRFFFLFRFTLQSFLFFICFLSLHKIISNHSLLNWLQLEKFFNMLILKNMFKVKSTHF
jgi:hypothetical protein